MPEEKVTEEETNVKIYEADSAKVAKLKDLMNQCLQDATILVNSAFPGEEGDKRAEMACQLAIALFHKASIPDQTETMLAALERGLEWYGQWKEKQKAESEKISADFQKSISAVLPKPTRRATALEILVRNLIDFTSRFAEVELTKFSDGVEEARETVTGGEVPTPEE